MTTPFDNADNTGFRQQIENRNAVFYHNLRIFIYGSDVTPYLTSSVNIRYSDRDGINSCSFSLSNQYSAFEMTPRNLGLGERAGSNFKAKLNGEEESAVQDDIAGNLGAQFRMTSPNSPEGIYSERVKAEIFYLKNANQIRHKVVKFGPVRGTRTGGRVLNLNDLNINESDAEDDTTTRYLFTVGSLVFHKFDPVRVFVQNPFSRGDDQWLNVFTGYIDAKPYSQDYVNGQSIINIQCQDIRVLMQGMRVQQNPAAQRGNENALILNENSTLLPNSSRMFFSDMGTNAKGTSLTHILGFSNFRDSVNFLLTGGTLNKVNGQGVGRLTSTDPVRYDPSNAETAAAALEDWNNIVLFGDTKDFLTRTEMERIGRETYHEGEASPDNATVRFLIPQDGGPPSNLVSAPSVDARVVAKIEWATRLDLVSQITKGVDYQMYVAGNGDFIFEFPMYDFFPPHFGETYNRLYSFEKHIVADNINDEGGQPISGLVVKSQVLRSELENNPTTADQTPIANSSELIRTIFSNVLASRVGIRIETASFPGITDQNRLLQLGMIEFNKRVANVNSFDLTTSYRPFIGINRPILHAVKDRMGITKAVNYSWNIRGEANLQMDLNYVRKREAGDSWKFITGGEKSPISYSSIYANAYTLGAGMNNNGPGEGTGGVPTEEPVGGGSSKTENNAPAGQNSPSTGT